MPTTHIQQIQPGAHIARWCISESEEELAHKGPHFLSDEWRELAQASRRKEWLASRLVLEELVQKQGLPFEGIEKDRANKPFLTGHSQSISISHTQGMAVAAISQRGRIGIDVEYRSPRVAKIAKRFLNNEEWAQTGGDWEELLVYWCAKESLYKLHGQKGVIFKKELLVHRKPGQSCFSGTIRAHGANIEVALQLEDAGSHIIVCAIEQ